MSTPRFRRRLCLVTDIERYSRHSNREQVDAQRRLTRVMQDACARAGIVWPRPQKQGDGQLIVMRPGLDETHAVPALVLGLRHGLYETNRDGGLFGRLRLRAALAEGIIATGANGYVGEAVIEACRVVDSPQMRAALVDDDSIDLALAVTDELFQAVVRPGDSTLDGADFTATAVAVPGKNFRSSAWLHTPRPGPAPAPPGPAPAATAGMMLRVRRSGASRAVVPGLGAVAGWGAVGYGGHATVGAEVHADLTHDPSPQAPHGPPPGTAASGHPHDTVTVHLDVHVNADVEMHHHFEPYAGPDLSPDIGHVHHDGGVDDGPGPAGHHC
ncbi:hypothetical protein [Couchioplanes azureus]|uniref:hypothetical protein n=1 Tax=Couchioplanes caeruleus TaxID=56438 RepID=UPI0016708261|nr:hypothetical protein [Couchioplanes caeruleus]GGQ48201.1 hypothetical protein GCM10010166_15440 [Couchioplanes caeruleus subsp. azureus]